MAYTVKRKEEYTFGAGDISVFLTLENHYPNHNTVDIEAFVFRASNITRGTLVNELRLLATEIENAGK